LKTGGSNVVDKHPSVKVTLNSMVTNWSLTTRIALSQSYTSYPTRDKSSLSISTTPVVTSKLKMASSKEPFPAHPIYSKV
jgi:hypothetical protein